MTRLYVIPGHGGSPYDPGAIGNGYKEAERVRVLAQKIKDLGGDSVMLHPFSDNAYASGAISRLSIPKDYQIVELHMDSNMRKGARGGSVRIHPGFKPDGYDIALAKFITGMFPGRAESIVNQSLSNASRAANKGYGYRLLECCFISNADDVAKFNSNVDDIARGVLKAFGIVASEAPIPSPAPKPPSNGGSSNDKKDLGAVTVRYGLRSLNGGWLDEIVNFNNSNSNGYAGVPNRKHDYLYIKVDKGSVKYRVHVVGGGWLPWVYKGDKNDKVNGCAGIGGKAIDGVQVYYTTPDGYSYKQAWYRSQTTKRKGWLGVCCDDGNSVKGYDGWAGIYGEPLDRLQISIGNKNPF